MKLGMDIDKESFRNENVDNLRGVDGMVGVEMVVADKRIEEDCKDIDDMEKADMDLDLEEEGIHGGKGMNIDCCRGNYPSTK